MTFRSMSKRMVEKLRVLLGAGLEAGVPALPGKTEVVGGKENEDPHRQGLHARVLSVRCALSASLGILNLWFSRYLAGFLR